MGNTKAKQLKADKSVTFDTAAKGRSLARTDLMNPNLYWFLKPCRKDIKILALRIDPKKVNKTHFVFEKLISKSQFG